MTEPPRTPPASKLASEAELNRRLTLDECIALISGSRGLHAIIPWAYRLADYPTRGVPRLGIPPLRFTDGPRGVNLGWATAFPVALARGASWDSALETEIGMAMATEAAAQGANALGSACLNIIRHPGWGRAQETFAADTTLVAAMGKALVSGIQSVKVLAVVKHYACNSIENSRFKVNVVIDQRALHEVYLPQFRACVEAGAAAFMSAYNRVNGIYCGENAALLNDILREQWGFQGFVMSDFILGTKSTEGAFNAGLDMEMPQTWHFSRRRIRRALQCGELDEATVRRAAGRIVGQLERFDHIQRTPRTSPLSAVTSKTHQQLALESARRSVVLLKNEGLLPLRETKSLAVIGPLARSANLGSEGSASVKPPYCVSLWQGLKTQFKGVRLRYHNGRSLRRAAALAARCDAVILTAGLRGRDEGEYFLGLAGGDRRRLELDDHQIDLIEAVAGANANTSVVLFGGSAIACGDWRHRVGALLMAWYPGMLGGKAVAEILAGEVNPSGRLPLSFPVRTADLPPFDPDAGTVVYDLWHDYRWLMRKGVAPAYGFGHGLGYSPVEYRHLECNVGEKESVLRVLIENTGEDDASEVVQVYLAADAPGGKRAPLELKVFQRVTIPGKSERLIELCLPHEQLAWYDPAHGDWVLEPGRYRLLCGPASTRLPLETGVTLPPA